MIQYQFDFYVHKNLSHNDVVNVIGCVLGIYKSMIASYQEYDLSRECCAYYDVFKKEGGPL